MSLTRFKDFFLRWTSSNKTVFKPIVNGLLTCFQQGYGAQYPCHTSHYLKQDVSLGEPTINWATGLGKPSHNGSPNVVSAQQCNQSFFSLFLPPGRPGYRHLRQVKELSISHITAPINGDLFLGYYSPINKRRRHLVFAVELLCMKIWRGSMADRA